MNALSIVKFGNVLLSHSTGDRDTDELWMPSQIRSHDLRTENSTVHLRKHIKNETDQLQHENECERIQKDCDRSNELDQRFGSFTCNIHSMTDIRLQVHCSNPTEIKDVLLPWLASTRDQSTKTVVIESPNGPGTDVDLMDIAPYVEETCACAGMELVRFGIGYPPVDIESVCSSPMAVTFKRKVLVVYHYDAISASDVSMTSAVHTAMKRNTVPIIVLTRSETRPTLKHCHWITLEGCRIVDTSRGVDGASAALLGQPQDFGGDNIAFGGVFDNYLCNGPLSIEDATRISEAYSLSECLSESLCRAGVFGDPYTYVPLMSASLVFKSYASLGNR